MVRAERLPDPTEFVGPILAAVKKEYVAKTYGIKDWEVSQYAAVCASVQWRGVWLCSVVVMAPGWVAPASIFHIPSDT